MFDENDWTITCLSQSELYFLIHSNLTISRSHENAWWILKNDFLDPQLNLYRYYREVNFHNHISKLWYFARDREDRLVVKVCCCWMTFKSQLRDSQDRERRLYFKINDMRQRYCVLKQSSISTQHLHFCTHHKAAWTQWNWHWIHTKD